MSFSDKVVWGMVAGCTATSISLILRYFREKEKTETKRRELELMQKTQQLAQEALTQNAAMLNKKMNDIVNHYNEEADKNMEELKRQIEENKQNDEFKKQLERLIMTANKMTEES